MSQDDDCLVYDGETTGGDPITPAEVEALAGRAGAAGQLALAGLLLAIGGAMCVDRERAMLDWVSHFSRAELRRIGRREIERN